jgi:hypothetical protein
METREMRCNDDDDDDDDSDDVMMMMMMGASFSPGPGGRL